MSDRHFMARFVAKRLAAAVLLLFLISLGTFALLSLAPGNPVDILLAGRPRTPELVRSLEQSYHLNGSFVERYVNWLGDAIHLNFGESTHSHQPVMDVIRQRIPLTLQLALMAFVIFLVLGVPLGVLAAVRQGGLLDRAIVGTSVLGLSIPPFVTGILLIYLFAVTLGWLPTFGGGDVGADRFEHLILPAVALAATTLAVLVKVTRSAMIRELDQDYVVFARARGQSSTVVVLRHALRNALIPIVTASGLVLGYMVGGAVLVEQVFSLPGMGSLLVSSAQTRDLPTLQGVVLIVATVVIVLNLLTDMLYLVLDPRVRKGYES